MLSVEDAVALLASRLGVVEGSESVSLVQADGRVLAQDVTAPLPLPPFTNSAVDGYALRGEDLPVGEERDLSRRRLGPGRRVRRACRGAGPGDPHLHRRADAGGRRHGVHAGRRAGRGDRHGHPAARPEARRQRPADRRGHRRGTGRAEGRPSPAPPGYRARRRARPHPGRGPAAHPGRRLFDRRRDRGARRAAPTGAAFRFQPLHADGDAAPAWAARSTISASCATIRRRSPRCSKAPAPRTT